MEQIFTGLVLILSLALGFYLRRKRNLLLQQENETGTPVQYSFFLHALKIASYSWLIVPTFADFGAMGGLQSIPTIGAVFLIPFLGWMSFIATLSNYTYLFIAIWIVFTVYLTFIIQISKKISDKKIIRLSIIIILYILYWYLSKLIIPYLLVHPE